MNTNLSKRLAATCRWTGRILGSFFVLVLLAFAIGEGMPNPLSQPLHVQLGFLGLGLLMVGLLAGWRWDLAGGLISLAGWVLFVVAAMRGRPNSFVLILALPPFLLLASALFSHRNERLAA
jgi:hypothetical protein